MSIHFIILSFLMGHWKVSWQFSILYSIIGSLKIYDFIQPRIRISYIWWSNYIFNYILRDIKCWMSRCVRGFLALWRWAFRRVTVSLSANHLDTRRSVLHWDTLESRLTFRTPIIIVWKQISEYPSSNQLNTAHAQRLAACKVLCPIFRSILTSSYSRTSLHGEFSCQ